MKKITILTGHYGTGKTNYAVNLALDYAKSGEKITVVDLDIVNPYFRTADFATLFAQNGITLIAPDYANSNVDIPVLSFDVAYLASAEGRLILDVGGDDAGATALGRFADVLRSYGDELDMRYVINGYRYLTQTPEEALTLMYEIEAAAHLTHTGIVNNSNLGRETTVQHITDMLPFAQKTAALAKLPLLHTTHRRDLPLCGEEYYPIDVYVQPLWGQDA